MRVNLFTKTQMLSIIRFIAMEYALQNGPEMELYLYSKDGYPLTISPTKITCFEEKVFEEKLTAKHIILASLYLEEPNIPHLAFVLKINRLLTNQSQMDYSKKIGVDILSSDGFSTKEAKEELGISTNTAYRLVSSCKEALYIVFGDDIQVVFNRSVNKYKIVIHKPRFLLNNIPYINI